jgi:hypothetical protein
MIDDTTPIRDFAAIEAAVMETALGRWFLAEHARRHRAADTERVLAALAALDARNHPAPAASEPTSDSAARALVLRRIGQIGGALAGLAAEIEALHAMLAAPATDAPAPAASPTVTLRAAQQKPAATPVVTAPAAPATSEVARRRLDAFDALPPEERLRLFY